MKMEFVTIAITENPIHDLKSRSESMETEFKPKKCPKCDKDIIPDVDMRMKTDAKHETIKILTGTPFFQHADVWYRCKNCGYQCHQTYKNGKLVSETV
jgi:RNase P subunit RPR2